MKPHAFEHVTPRGIRGIIIPRPGSSTFYSAFSFHAGSRLVPDYADKEQTAHVMEHVAANVLGFSGKGEFDELFRKNGAYRNASTSSEYMRYTAKCASFEWQRILDMQIQMLSKPNFNEDIISSEKKNVRSELEGHLNDPRWVIDGRCEVAMGNKDMGLEEQIRTINNVSLDDVIAFHKLTHTIRNMRYVIAGDVAGVIKKIDKIIDSVDLSSGDSLPVETIKLHCASPVLVRRDKTPNITFYMPIVLHKCLSIKEEYTLAVLCDLLTGSLNSLLYGPVRRQGLAYDIRATYAIERFNSYFMVRTAAPKDNLVKIACIVSDVMQEIRVNGVSEDILERSKSRLSGRLMMGFETAQSLAYYLENRYLVGDTVINIDELPSIVKSVTLSDVCNLVVDLVKQNTWTFGLFGNVDGNYTGSIASVIKEIF